MIVDNVSQAHLARLAEAMAPDPGEWRFDGEVTDAGNMVGLCACGAHIRYQFWIGRTRDGSKLAIGSICIEKSVPWLIDRGAGALAGDLAGALDRHKDALAEARRAMKLAEAERRLDGVVEDARALAAWVEDERRERWAPRSSIALLVKVRLLGTAPDVRGRQTLAGMLGTAVADLALSERTQDRFPPPRSEEGRERAMRTLAERRRREEETAERHAHAAEDGRSVEWNTTLADAARRKADAHRAAFERFEAR